jgi:tryptophan synthase alpha chain
MSRLESTFTALRAANARGLITFIEAGDPDLPRSAGIVAALDRSGADVIELGVPYSDPVADGPVIQRASERAVSGGVTLRGVLDLVASVRADVRAPIVLFTYANPVFRLGAAEFAAGAAVAGVDGVLIVDLPAEEAGGLQGALSRCGLDMIFLVSPTTSGDRLVRTARCGSGFLYAISRLGVTGDGDGIVGESAALVRRIRRCSPLPVALGFGISTPEHVRVAVREADAAVVGSGLVSVIEQAGEGADVVERVETHVRWLRTALDGGWE